MSSKTVFDTLPLHQLDDVFGGKLRPPIDNGGRPPTYGRVSVDQQALGRAIPSAIIGAATGAAGGPWGMALGAARGAAGAFATSLRWSPKPA